MFYEFLFLFVKYFFGSLKFGNQLISWMLSPIKSDHFFLFDQTFDQQNILTNKIYQKVPDHVCSKSYTYISKRVMNNKYVFRIIAYWKWVDCRLKKSHHLSRAKSNNKQNTRVNFRNFSLTFWFSRVIKVLFVLIETVLINVEHLLTDFWQFGSRLFEKWIQVFLDFYGYKL